MEQSQYNLLMLNTKIFRYTQSYLDKALKKYELSSGSFRYLFILEHEEGICQNEISEKIGNDKAMSARTISRLINAGYITKEKNENDVRAYKLFLTPKAKETIPVLHRELDHLIRQITVDLTPEEDAQMMQSLYNVFQRVRKLNE